MMSRQNDSGFPQSELDMIEHAMGSMLQGTLSMLVRTLLESDNSKANVIMESTQEPSGMIGDGSDFRKLANKSRQHRGLPVDHTASEPPQQLTTREPGLNDHQAVMNPPMPNILQFLFGHSVVQPEPGKNDAGTLLDLMMPDDHLFNNMDPESVAQPSPSGHVDPSQGANFSFSSTSQRRIVKADGTEETHYTRTQNGVTETFKRTVYPDGTVEEVKETGNAANKGMFSPLSSIGFHNQSDEQRHPGVLSSMWRRMFGQS